MTHVLHVLLALVLVLWWTTAPTLSFALAAALFFGAVVLGHTVLDRVEAAGAEATR